MQTTIYPRWHIVLYPSLPAQIYCGRLPLLSLGAHIAMHEQHSYQKGLLNLHNSAPLGKGVQNA